MASPETPETAPVRRRRRDPEAPELYALAYEEARRRVDDQLAELDAVRTRAIQYLALTLTATAFLVGTSLSAAERDLLFYCLATAATLFAFLALLLGLAVLVGRRRPHAPSRFTWRFRLSGQALLEWIELEVPSTPSKADFTRALAQEYDHMFEHNSSNLAKIRRYYALTVAAAFISILMWVGLVWSRA